MKMLEYISAPEAAKKMGYFRKASTKAMQGKPHTRRGKIQPYVADTKKHGKAD